MRPEVMTTVETEIMVKGKAKGHPITVHEDPEGK
jgi:hypothetical protein